MVRRIVVASVFALMLASAGAWRLPAKESETRWAFVENQTSDEFRLTYEETADGQKAKRQVPLYPGYMRRVDATALLGEVCAWRVPEMKPAEKVGCRILKPGDRWVIH
jgi:hypothetical protein